MFQFSHFNKLTSVLGVREFGFRYSELCGYCDWSDPESELDELCFWPTDANYLRSKSNVFTPAIASPAADSCSTRNAV